MKEKAMISQRIRGVPDYAMAARHVLAIKYLKKMGYELVNPLSLGISENTTLTT